MRSPFSGYFYWVYWFIIAQTGKNYAPEDNFPQFIVWHYLAKRA
jgi:hypothetical protein